MKKILPVFLSLCILAIMPLTVKAEEIKGKIEQNQFSHYIEVTKSQIPLNSRLKKEYAGYSYTITSQYPGQLDLLVGNVPNGINGQVAYMSVEKSSAAAIGSTIGGGFVLGFVTLGISFLAALIATPFIYFSNNSANNKAKIEGLRFSNQIPTGSLNTGDTLSFTTLIPISQIPALKLQFREVQTSELYTINK